MKKTLALLLSLVLVATACGAMFVSAEATNLALGKEVLNAEVNVANGNYCANMTDGVIADAISTENGVWFGYLYNADKPENANTAADGVAIPTIDLGEVTDLGSVRIHIVDQADWGIAAPHSIVAQVSNDGENFTDVTTVTEFQSGVAWVEFDLSGQSAQYVRLAIDLATTWFFLDEIEIYGAGAGSDEPVEPETPATEGVSANVTVGTLAYDESALAKLFDGNAAAGATAFSDAGFVSFENKGFSHGDGVDAAVEAAVELVRDLGSVQAISKITLNAFKDSNSMIALPEVKFYVSIDGVNYYEINSGNPVKAADDAAEVATAALTADFSTRIAVNARYVKAVATFKNGWIFLSELGVTAATEGNYVENPGVGYAYTEHSVPNPGIGIFDSTDGELDLSLNDGETGKLFRNAQLIKAKYDADKGAYVVIYSKVNPWPDGHTGTETLGEGEILLAISTGGNVGADNNFSGCKWIARGLTEGDYLVLDNGTVSFYPANGQLPGAEDDPPVTGDAGILVFAVLAVVAIAGCAVASKIKSSAL